MPTSYTVQVFVSEYLGNPLGDMLDGLEIITGSTSPYELPQPPSARASFIGLPVISGVTQTPDWWLDKTIVFTILPQGATGNVVWQGEVQSYTVSPIEHNSTTQLVELDILGVTSKLSNYLIQNETVGSPSYDYWTNLPTYLDLEVSRTSWSEVPAGLTWALLPATTTWNSYTNNIDDFVFQWDTCTASTFFYGIPAAGRDLLTFVTDTVANKYKGWVWYDKNEVTFNAPSNGYLNYTQITSLDATSCVNWSSLNASQNLSNIVNNANMDTVSPPDTIGYYAADSYKTFGSRYYDFGTTYEAAFPADYPPLVLADKVNAYKAPNKYLQSFTVDLDQLTHVTGEWQNFYKSTKPVRLPVTNIPTAYGGNHTYMVRGVQLSLTNKHAEATLVVVPSTIYNPS